MIRRWLITATLFLYATTAAADDIKLAVTTSFHNSGLAEILLPAIKRDTGLTVQLLVVGTGQALRLGQAGDVDAILVHAKVAEDAFVAAGDGVARVPLMYNDFVLVGPATDPARVGATRTISDALATIATAQHPFVSRGDDSGTHKKELSLWTNVAKPIPDFGPWYRAVGSGMGTALNTAVGMNAYILSDRASWLNFKNKADFGLLFQGDPALFNQYSFIAVNPAKHSHIQAGYAIDLQNWLTGDTAKSLINSYRLEGQQLFTFNADQ